jgi:hypothetical protein
MSIFKKAERKQVKLKLAITGPSGAGKTFSALKIAQGLSPSGRIAFIDTENGSGSLYADTPGMPEYDVIELAPPFTSERYMKIIDQAVAEKYDVLIIDSISHQWNGEGGIMDRKDKEQQAKPTANSYALWAKYTPEHERFKQKLLQSQIHLIATMRSKQDYILETNDKGKTAPRKVGLAPIQREGAEYEFTTVFDMTTEHIATVSKDRTGLFDQEYFKPDEITGKRIKDWMASGKEFMPEAEFKMGEQEWAAIESLSQAAQITKADLTKYLAANDMNPRDLDKSDFDQICGYLNENRKMPKTAGE